jgi:hypothetical protein
LLISSIGTFEQRRAHAQGDDSTVSYSTDELVVNDGRAANVRKGTILANGKTKREELGSIRARRQQNSASSGMSATTTINAAPDPGPGDAFSFTSNVLTDNASLTGFNIRPPDSMGAVGPTQFLTHNNGYIRTHHKASGAEDGIINIIDDYFWPLEIRTTPNAFLTDPRVHYDRATDRWFMIMIDVPDPIGENSILIAVSNTGRISRRTRWNFYYVRAGLFPGDAGCLADYPTFGIDNNAVYIGTSMFRVAGGPLCPGIVPGFSFHNTTAFVIRKADLLGNGPADLASVSGAVTAFPNLINPATFEGPFTLHGAVNYDPNPTEGYMVAVDAGFYGRLALYRVVNPGSGTPALDGPSFIDIPLNFDPGAVPTPGAINALDGLDYRLINAMVRNGKLLTSQGVCVDQTGIEVSGCFFFAELPGSTRNGMRWYVIDVAGASPSLVDVGQVWDGSNSADPLSLWMGSIAQTGQGHYALGYSIAGRPLLASAAADWLLRTPGGLILGDSYAYIGEDIYNAPGDIAGVIARWGDYSLTTVDPCDDMTAWTIQEFAARRTGATSGPGSQFNWGTRVFRMPAPPPPADNVVLPSKVSNDRASANVFVQGDVSDGQGYYNPPSVGMAPCRTRLRATANNNVRVLAITYVNPGSVIVALDTRRATTISTTVEVTNPDGQTTTIIVPIVPAPTAPNGLIWTNRPVFRWQALPSVSEDSYELEVVNTTTNATVFSVEVNAQLCGRFSCAFRSPSALAVGDYAFRVRANDEGVWSLWSDPLAFSVATPSTQPDVAPPFVP